MLGNSVRRAKRVERKIDDHYEYWVRFVWHRTHPDDAYDNLGDFLTDAARGGGFVPCVLYRQTQFHELNGSPYVEQVKSATFALRDTEVWEGVAQLFTWAFIVESFALANAESEARYSEVFDEMIETSRAKLGWECDELESFVERRNLLVESKAPEFRAYVVERCVERLGGEPYIDESGVPQLSFITSVCRASGWNEAFGSSRDLVDA